MIKIVANILGILAVGMFVFSYQLKTRKMLIFFNAGSRILYVLQYILLGAWDGAVMDSVAFLVSIVAERRKQGWVARHTKLTITFANLAIIVAGLLFYKNPLTLLAIAGVLFETGALWLTKEKSIRILSFFGAPCWLIYNLFVGAYGGAAGNVLTVVSIGLAIIRNDIKKKEP